MIYLKGEDDDKQRQMVEKIKEVTKRHLVVIKTKDDKIALVSDSDPVKEELEEDIEMLENAIKICENNLKELEDLKIN